MTIGEHLEELRRHVLKAVGWIFLALMVCLYFQKELFELAVGPHRRTVETIRTELLTREAAAKLAARTVALAEKANEADHALAAAIEALDRTRAIAREQSHPGAERLEDLRARQERAKATAVALRARFDALDPKDAQGFAALEADRAALGSEVAVVRALVATDVQPLLDSAARAPSMELQSVVPTDTFMAFLKLAFVAALFVAAPMIVYELWKFISVGLFPHEKRWVNLFGPLSYACFAAGFMFGYLVLIPIGLQFMASYAPSELVVGGYTVSGYLSLFITLSLITGLIFELPLVMVFMTLIGITDAAKFRSWRRYWLLAAFIIGAILTPPDPITQSLMAIPLLGLYEVGILLSALVRPAASPHVADPTAVPVAPAPPAAPAPLQDRVLAPSVDAPVDEGPSRPDPRYPETPVPPPGAPPPAADTAALDPMLAPRPAPEGTLPRGAAQDPTPPPDPVPASAVHDAGRTDQGTTT